MQHACICCKGMTVLPGKKNGATGEPYPLLITYYLIVKRPQNYQPASPQTMGDLVIVMEHFTIF